ncbi:MAG: coniferyl-alcohol dehydrogenase [Acidimicrobiaceae bacterium]|nr:coniferyl-alcohol dehydrogenase [Acidimicrobiaceae bacterium]
MALIDDMWGYQDKRVVVTGCASGIGAATARELRKLGAHVTGLDIHKPTVEVDEYVQLDLSDRASIEDAAARITPPVDAQFNCAGLSGGGGPPLLVMRVNFIGLRHLTTALLPAIPSGGAIVSIASTGGMAFRDNMAAVRDFLAVEDFDPAVAWCEAHDEQFPRGGYTFSKQSLIVWTMLQARPLADRGVRINCTGPGMTATPMLQDSAKLLGQEYLDRFPRPLGRDARPEEQAWPLIFLNSEAASYVTGQLLWVDGGLVNGLALGTIDQALMAR